MTTTLSGASLFKTFHYNDNVINGCQDVALQLLRCSEWLLGEFYILLATVDERFWLFFRQSWVLLFWKLKALDGTAITIAVSRRVQEIPPSSFACKDIFLVVGVDWHLNWAEERVQWKSQNKISYFMWHKNMHHKCQSQHWWILQLKTDMLHNIYEQYLNA